jgi:hypothetical protein
MPVQKPLSSLFPKHSLYLWYRICRKFSPQRRQTQRLVSQRRVQEGGGMYRHGAIPESFLLTPILGILIKDSGRYLALDVVSQLFQAGRTKRRWEVLANS